VSNHPEGRDGNAARAALARVAERLIEAEDDDQQFVGRGLMRILENPAQLARSAFRLPSKRGGEPAWRAERRRDRDDALAMLIDRAPGPLERKVRAVLHEIAEYEGRGWRIDRESGRRPADPKRGLLYDVLSTGVRTPKASQLKAIAKRAARDRH
jgi:hypothetical protein